MSAENQRGWDARIGEIERFLNSAPHKTTTKSPFEELHGYQPRFHGGTLSSLSLTRNEWIEPHEMQQLVRKKIDDGQQRMKGAYDLKRTGGIKFDTGEVVVMLRQPTTDQPSKLQAKYRERPLQVFEVLPSDTYRVAQIASDGKELYATTAHVSQLKSRKILSESEVYGGESDVEDEPGVNGGESDEEDQPGDNGGESDVEDQPEAGDDITQGKPSGGRSRPTRHKRLPNHLNDFKLM